MQDTIFDTRICVDEQGNTHSFHYSLLTEQIPAGSFTFEDYGVRVCEVGGDTAQLRSITHSRSRIEELLALLSEHAVSPAGLADVVEDWAKENHLPQPVSRQVADIG